MRVLKFRAFIKSTGIMADLQKITPLALSPGLTGGVYIPDREGFVIMQSLGLNGVNGVELYEGDIIEAGHGEIFYNEKRAKFQVRWHTETFKRIRGSNPSYNGGEDIFGNHEISFEVIGNIYQNPELLS